VTTILVTSTLATSLLDTKGASTRSKAGEKNGDNPTRMIINPAAAPTFPLAMAV